MGNIHHATAADGTKFKYQEPSAKINDEKRGIVFEKKDAKTGETKLKSAEGPMKLLMKLRGYSEAKLGTCRKFLQAKFQADGNFGEQLYNVRDVKSTRGYENTKITAYGMQTIIEDTERNTNFAKEFLKEKYGTQQ